uniref:NADH-ubiquinone oxidoreductase chain 4 n=1 Tax=Armillifer agkistrodontis TaxID=592791 RepID=A0A1J0CYJ1_ARMAG|nr:NADH dehydrogenase subunit 4 [Armillifer agkistrodontis]APB92073.1 NADH dehydrogenase subunit 4 [Armillifer agkistrodontis]
MLGVMMCLMMLVMAGRSVWMVVGVIISGLMVGVMWGLEWEGMVWGGWYVDYVSWFLIVMSYLLFFLMIQSSYEYGGSLLISVVVFMMGFVIFSFLVVDFIVFYVFFEASMLPMVMILGGWGYQPERLGASVYMMMYTVFGSLIFLVSLSMSSGWEMKVMDLKMSLGEYMIGFLVVFLVKLPVYGLHVWLPKAHLEASSWGSMILAGVLLKLGGYGLYRVMVYGGESSVSGVLSVVGLLGGVMSGGLCLRQVDIKKLMAYSSLSHMCFVIIGYGSGSFISGYGMVVVMVAHGFSSSGLFFLSGIMYKLVGSRSIYMVGSYSNLFVGLIAFLCIFNVAVPPTIGMFGELMIYVGVSGYAGALMWGLGLVSFLIGAYSIYLYSLMSRSSGWISGGEIMMVSDYYILLIHYFWFVVGGAMVCLL